MDQVKIGRFMRELRKEKALTQEQLAEKFGVSNRTVSRWENGNNMPDISILIELADFYGVDMRELLSGERKSEKMDKDVKETLEMVAEYTDAEKEKMLRSIVVSIIFGAAAFLFLFVMLLFSSTVGFKDKADSGTSAFIAWFGFTEMAICFITVMQIKGSMTKNRMKKIRKIGIPICAGLILVCAVIILVLTTNMFRSEKLDRDTSDISDYGEWYGLLSRSNLEVFPESIPKSAENVEYRFYNDDSVDPSSLVFLKCTYDSSDYTSEIARLESIEGARRDDENYSGTAYVTLLHKFESEYALAVDDNTIVYVCFAEGVDPELPKSEYLRSTTASDPEWFSIYDFSDYDDYKYWPETWKQKR